MRASRIFALARTMRWASVGGAVRKARAISSVVKPHTSRRVSAIWASGGRAGWQQVKIRRSRSSAMSSAPPGVSRLASASRRSASSDCEASNRARRRMASMALCRPAETSHARGLAGVPSRGHCSTAAAKASCSASSARSKPPSRRMSVASTRRDSDRYTAATTSRASSIEGSLMRGSSRPGSSSSGVRQLQNGPDLDDTDARGRKSRGDLACLVDVLGLDEKEAPELLLRLGEGAVGRGDLAAVDPDSPGGLSALQGVRDDIVAALSYRLVVVEGRIDEGLQLALGHRVEHVLIVIDHEHELHLVLLRLGDL